MVLRREDNMQLSQIKFSLYKQNKARDHERKT